MSICCSFHSIQDQHIDQLQAEPELVWAWVAPDDEFQPPPVTGFWEKLFGVSKPASAPTPKAPCMGTGENQICDIDKAWHGLHDCLITLNPKLNFLLEGGQELSAVDVGYGPPRLFRAQQAQQLLQQMQNLQDFKQSYDAKRLKAHDIYPQIWEDEALAGQDYLYAAFEQVKHFLQHCQSHTLGFVLCMS